MSRPVVFRPEANAEVVDTREWYAGRQPELGDQFAAEVDNTMVRIAENPLAFPKAHGEIRRAVLRRFPYAIYFRELGDTIVVLAVHGRQDPKRWQSRR